MVMTSFLWKQWVSVGRKSHRFYLAQWRELVKNRIKRFKLIRPVFMNSNPAGELHNRMQASFLAGKLTDKLIVKHTAGR